MGACRIFVLVVDRIVAKDRNEPVVVGLDAIGSPPNLFATWQSDRRDVMVVSCLQSPRWDCREVQRGFLFVFSFRSRDEKRMTVVGAALAKIRGRGQC